ELVGLVLHDLVELGVAQQGFGRDAAPVEAGATGTVHLDTGDFFPELGGADCPDISCRATTDDDEIVFAHFRAKIKVSGKNLPWANDYRRWWLIARDKVRSTLKPPGLATVIKQLSKLD
ncbi:MAG: hypothetical protein ACI9MB_001242, partial [Verrucomicrobiales bacterium]